MFRQNRIPDQTNKLMELAVQLHDREVQRRGRWKTVIVPTVVAIIAAGASIVAAVISSSSKSREHDSLVEPHVSTTSVPVAEKARLPDTAAPDPALKSGLNETARPSAP